MSKLILSILFFIVVISLASGQEDRPEEPYDLVVRNIEKKSARIIWQHEEHGTYTKFWLRIYSTTPVKETRGIDIPNDDTEFLIQNLKPNTTYELELYTMNGHLRSSDYAPASFTTLPDNPQEIYTSIITETTLTVHYNTSYLSDKIDNIRFFFDISPKDKYDVVDYYLIDPVREYVNLIPGKLYTISVSIVNVEKNKSSNAKIIQVRTIPTPPIQSPDFVSHFVRPVNFMVSWLPPTGLCEFNHYHISTFWYDNGNRNYPHEVESFYSAPEKLSHHFLNYPNDATYTVEVRTVSFNQQSKPLILQITKEMNLISEHV